jgi:hypothetical protein
MSVEERLGRVLQEEADRIEVDVPRLHARTLGRLPSDVRHRRTRLLAPLLGAALLLTVLGGIALLRLGDDTRTGPPTHDPVQGGVDTQFTCPVQITADEAAREVDDALVLDLAEGPAAAARSLGAPRYAYDESGRRAILRLGNADGSLAATATFQRQGGGWVLDTTQRCGGEDNGISVPGSDELRLGRRDATPYPAGRFALDAATAVFVDDRTTYDQSGFAQHRTVWAAPCERSVCVVGGTPNSHAVGDIARNAGPENISGVLLDADAMVGRKAGLVLWAVYDTDGTVTSVTARHRDGSTRPAEVVRGSRWTGRLLLLLDEPDRVAAVTVQRSDGTTRDYAPAEIAD